MHTSKTLFSSLLAGMTFLTLTATTGIANAQTTPNAITGGGHGAAWIELNNNASHYRHQSVHQPTAQSSVPAVTTRGSHYGAVILDQNSGTMPDKTMQDKQPVTPDQQSSRPTRTDHMQATYMQATPQLDGFDLSLGL